MRLERPQRPDARIEAGTDQIIVEVGAGRSLHMQADPDSYMEAFERNTSVQYYALDWMPDVIDEGKQNARALHTETANKRIHFLRCDCRHMPFKNQSVAEVIMENVLGGGTSVPSELIEEAARVLKRDGVLKIVEYYEPWEAKNGPLQYMESYPGAFVPVDEHEVKTPIDESSLNKKMREQTTFQNTDGFILYFRRV
jgi:ubiquinone/menaquinone biosynthesis C-methylase UbiE